MKKILMTAIVFLLVLPSFQGLYAQQHPPFYDDIERFKKEDGANTPPANAVLFVGSSSIRKWSDVQTYFPRATIINRGFGGCELTDVIRYAKDIILPYHPRQIVIYAGENDLAYSDTTTAVTVLLRVITLFDIIRSAMPSVPVIYLSLKPSPSRKRLMPEMEDANKRIRNFLLSRKNAVFLDVYHKMLNADGKPIPGLYESDSLHMNASGYATWQKIIDPYLLKDKK